MGTNFFTDAAVSLGANEQSVAQHLQDLWDHGADFSDGFGALGGVMTTDDYQTALDSLTGETLGLIATARIDASRGADKYAGIGWDPAPATGSPVIRGTLGHVDCTVHAVHEAGDHWIVIGRVQALDVHADAADPLLFYQGKYHTTQPPA